MEEKSKIDSKNPIINDFGVEIQPNKYYKIKSGCCSRKTAKYLEVIFFWKFGGYDVNFLDSNYKPVMDCNCNNHHWTKIGSEDFKKIKLTPCFIPVYKRPKFIIKGDDYSLC